MCILSYLLAESNYDDVALPIEEIGLSFEISTKQALALLMVSLPVLFERLPTTNGRYLGHVKLNALATLNSLSLEMIDLIQAKIDEWRATHRFLPE